MTEPSVYVCRTDTPEGVKDYITTMEVGYPSGVAGVATIPLVLIQENNLC